MINIDTSNVKILLLVAEEIRDTTGQLWLKIYGEDLYLPELIEKLKMIQEHKIDYDKCN